MNDVAAAGNAASGLTQAKPGGWRMFDFRKPIDMNTIVIVLSFLGGGLYFVADTKAQLSSMATEVHDLRDQIFTMTQRVDTLFLRQVGRGGGG